MSTLTFSAAAPFLAAAFCLAVELVNPRPRRSGTSREDRGSFWLLQCLLGAGLFAAFWLIHSPLVDGWRLGGVAAPLGLGVTVFGGILRIWAIRTLGAYFTRSVQTSASQPIVEAGPYRFVRHPSYTGSATEFLGIGLACGNWLSLACAVLTTAVGLAYRMRIEEAALVAAIGDSYRSYMARTKRWVPFVY